jgi:hypothetical protein
VPIDRIEGEPLMRKLILLFVMSSLSLSAHAKVPPEQAARLETDLTPFGSERGASADGSIPAWTGGLSAPPEGIGYVPGEHLPDPFADEAPLLRVTGANVDTYDAYVTRGQKALLERHGTYFLDVYPTQRSCANPEFVYKAARRNAEVGELVAEGNGVG